jgi:hypothetical protein
MTGTYATREEHEAALTAAELSGYVAIRIIKAPYPNWTTLYTHLAVEGDAEGTIWQSDATLNDALRVVGPAKNAQNCWFSIFLPSEVYATIKFIDGVYDLSKIAGGEQPELRGCIAVHDTIFMRRGVDHGALVEVTTDTTKNPQGYAAIEDHNQLEMWRLTQRLAALAERYFDVQAGTRIAIRTRYRPKKLLVIHTVMVASRAHSMGMEWKVMHKLRQLRGQPADLLLDDRRFRLTDFEHAETAHAPLNDARMENQRLSDENTQGRRCTIDNLPPTCDSTRLEDMLQARGLQLVGNPVIIDSKFRKGTRVAFVMFDTEDMAMTAILEAPFMTMSGLRPTIKPSQPKANRSLSKVEADERARMDKMGPSDGMSRTQFADVVKRVDSATGPQLDFLRMQFKIDDEGTFANAMVNEFRAEMNALREDFHDARDEICGAIALMDHTLTERATAQGRFQTAMSRAVDHISEENKVVRTAVAESLDTINTNITAQAAMHQNELRDVNTRLDALSDALQRIAFGEDASDTRSSPPHDDQGHPEDSDDSREDVPTQPTATGAATPNAQPHPATTQSPAKSDTTAVPTQLLDQHSQIQLGNGLTVADCRHIVAAHNAALPQDQHLPIGPTTNELYASATTAASAPRTLAPDHDPNTTTPSANTTQPNDTMVLGPPQIALGCDRTDLDLLIHQKWGGNIKDMFTAQAANPPTQGMKRQAASPSHPANSPVDSPTQEQSEQLASPPRTKQRPEINEQEAREYIFRLTHEYPDNPAFQHLKDGYNSSLIPRGVRARDILESLTPHSSPLSYDQSWVGKPNTVTAGMTGHGRDTSKDPPPRSQ